MQNEPSPAGRGEREIEFAADRERLLHLFAALTFLIFFQAYMVAPLIPRLADLFNVSVQNIGLAVPAYLIPYGFAVLLYGPLSDRLGRGRVMLASLLAFILLTASTAAVRSSGMLIVARLLTGLGASGVVPIALASVGDLFRYNERGRALGWLFGAMAGGMAFGSTVGAVLEPLITWRGLFIGVAGLATIVSIALLPYTQILNVRPADGGRITFAGALMGTRNLLQSSRGKRTYGYVLFNGIFHSGVFTWLGLYFSQRHGLTEVGIGLALLGYGVPGFLMGPAIGRLADRVGRSLLIPIGVGISAASAFGLSVESPIVVAALLVTTLSLGYDMTQPLLAGIVTDLGPQRGLAMGLNVFMLFVGFGLGSLLFAEVLRFGFSSALMLFGTVAMIAASIAGPLFRGER
jgi:predicted MFS family arabinose efflux permease